MSLPQKAALAVAVVAGVSAVATFPEQPPKALQDAWQAFVAAWPWGERLFFVAWTVCVIELTFWPLNAVLFWMYTHNVLPAYRIKSTQPFPEWKLIKECLTDVSIGHLVVRPIVLFAGFDLFKAAGIGIDVPLPGLWTVAWQIFVCIMVDDTLFYWSHRLLHHPKIYGMIHKKHHTFKHTIGIAVEYAHPVEDLVSNTLSTVAGPLLLGSHVTVFWMYSALKLWQSIDAHSGYNLPFPISPFSFITWMDCAPAHDYHHSNNLGNFGGFFIFWDWLMGTDEKYLKHLQTKKGERCYASVMR